MGGGLRVQVQLQPVMQRQASGNGASKNEPNLSVQSLIIMVSQINVQALGSVTFKVQHSPDNIGWLDVPGLTTGAITGPGNTTVTLNSMFVLCDFQRIVFTFTNANIVTFGAYITALQ